MSYETIGAYGMLDIDTPHLDTLVEQGACFSHAYNMGACGGRDAWPLGVRDNTNARLTEQPDCERHGEAVSKLSPTRSVPAERCI
jgi:hypothetical protein